MEKLNSIPAGVISREQFGFLSNRQIRDIIGVSLECIHFDNLKKRKSIVMKLDLEKA